MKGNKGITLIALVVTIIVLLILAGVAIAMLTGDNSILKRAQSTKPYTTIGAAKDEVGLAYDAAYTEYIRKYYDDAVTDKTTLSVMTEFNKALTRGKVLSATENNTAAPGSHGAKVELDQDAGTVTITTTTDGKTYSVVGTVTGTTSNNTTVYGTGTTFKWNAITDPTLD